MNDLIQFLKVAGTLVVSVWGAWVTARASRSKGRKDEFHELEDKLVKDRKYWECEYRLEKERSEKLEEEVHQLKNEIYDLNIKIKKIEEKK